jgi:gliding motility-associated lipoprotein GldH
MKVALTCLLFLAIASFFISCDPPNYIFEDDALYDHQKPLTYRDSLVYNFKVKDTNRFYNLLIEIDHNKNYSWENLYVKIDTRFPDREQKSQLLSMTLADETGEWYSDCRGKTCTFYLTLQEQTIFPMVGDYQIKLFPWMRQDTIKDIYRIGFKVERDGKRK